jgi:hypothetical protein
MRHALVVLAAVALIAASAAPGARTVARIWLAAPSTLAGSGFPAGKVTVSAQGQNGKTVKVVRAALSGRFTVHFGTPITYDACHFALFTAVGKDGARATTKLGGGSKDCAPRIEQP